MQNEKTYFFIFIAEQHPSLFKISKRSTISRHIRIKVKSEKSKCIVAISLFRQTFSLFIFNCARPDCAQRPNIPAARRA